jgi:deazaflavin-dependent oxidoreductase (nitroreductase family)
MASSDQAFRAMPMQRFFNVLVLWLLRSPLHRVLSGRLAVVTVTGRKTGRTYRIPVGYVEHDGEVLVGSPGTWTRNLGGGALARVRVRGRELPVRAEVVTDPDRAAPLYKIVIARNPVHGRFAGIDLDEHGELDLGQLRAAFRRGIVLVRLLPR